MHRAKRQETAFCRVFILPYRIYAEYTKRDFRPITARFRRYYPFGHAVGKRVNAHAEARKRL